MSAASEYKRLAWVPSLTTTASTYAIGTYAYLKDNAGPLKVRQLDNMVSAWYFRGMHGLF